MQMTNEEIIRRYKNGADKKAQVNILAQLNGESPEKIRNILQTAGVLEGIKRRGRKPKAETEPKAEEEKAEEKKADEAAELKEDLTEREPKITLVKGNELPKVVKDAVVEKYHDLLRLKELYLNTVRVLDRQIEDIESYLSGGKMNG